MKKKKKIPCKYRFMMGLANSVRSFFFYKPLLLIQESLIQLSVSGLLFWNIPDELEQNLIKLQYLTYSQSRAFSIMCFIFAFIVFPIVSVIVFLSDKKTLNRGLYR